MNIVKEIVKGERVYKCAETPLGNVVFYELGGGYVQYRNLTQQDFFWSLSNIERFYTMFGRPAVEIFRAKRLTGLEKAVKVPSTGGTSYQLARKKKYDGYIYEIDASAHRAIKKAEYPDAQFVYTRYYEPAIKTLERNALEAIKTEQIIKFNRHSSYDVAQVSVIIDEVYRMINEEETENDAN